LHSGASMDGCMAQIELTQGAFSGPHAFADLIRNAVAAADAMQWTEMVWSDASFEDWPLRERAVVDAMHTWARTGRKLTLLAHRFDALPRLHPRFVSWRVTWDHIVSCRVCKSVDASEFPSALWAPTWVLHRLDPVRCTGIAGSEPRKRLLLREALDECLRQSGPGFPATTLGL